MFKQEHIQQLNEAYKSATPAAIIKKALEVSRTPVVTTNFRPYEAAILHAVSKEKSDIPVIWCDTGYNTRQTYEHAQTLIKTLNLNIALYVPQQTVAYRDFMMGIPMVDNPQHAQFTEQVKLEPFRRAMATHKPDVWFTNLRQGQTAFRNSIDIFSLSQDAVLKVSPFYYWNDTDLDKYLEDNKLPNEFKYFDPTKALENRECGLHN